ncbi:DUF3604 domain-containing protein [SAR92 clade bacterium H246]
MAEQQPDSVIAHHYSPALNRDYPTRVFWGDTHLHTNLSFDAYTFGNRRLGLAEAYQFAKGNAVQMHNGMLAQLNRPLDFLVIADHASNMGAMQGLENNDPQLLLSEQGRDWAEKLTLINQFMSTDPPFAAAIARQIKKEGFVKGRITNETFRRNLWAKVIATANQHNNPGRFTAFIGFEWTEIFNNLHRVVIFKDAADKVGTVRPFSQWDSRDPEDLWDYMAAYEANTGGEILAIPHNGNLGSGVMFALEDIQGKPLSSEYAAKRQRWEPLYEVTQTKGDSETHPRLSPADHFADYETIPPYKVQKEESLIVDLFKQAHRAPDDTSWDSWLEKIRAVHPQSPVERYQYARSALQLGLTQQTTLGVNPFKFGMVGGTDSHTSLASVDDTNFYGVLTLTEPNPQRLLGTWEGTEADSNFASTWWGQGWRMNSAGYTGIWAEENTREALFAAMKRKEVYASTGPRITIRFFAGWDFQENDLYQSDFVRLAYSKGVPMGGDLASAPGNKSPVFLIRAVKDPDGANLDRVQVIKGWQDTEGRLHEKIYNVALAGNRKPDRHGKVEPVGNTVSIKQAIYHNSIGDTELAVVWQDPDFDKTVPAFYYLRVLEIPTPRWSAYDAKYFNLKDIPKEVPMITQDRAYTSPIWYSP